MKYFAIAFFIFSILFFASCSKEEVKVNSSFINGTIGERSTVIEIEVSKVSYTIDAGEMEVHFSASHDFSEVVVESTQHLKFEDAGGSQSTLTFQTQSFNGSNGNLDITFLVGSNNLSGLDLTNVQEIIIEDEIIE